MINTKTEFKSFIRRANNAIMKASFLCPTKEDIKVFEGNSFNYKQDGTIYPIKSSGNVSLTRSEGKINLNLTGEIDKLSEEAKEALFVGDQTNATVILICLPSSDISNITYKRDSEEAKAINSNDVIEIEGISYFVLVLGVYSVEGVTTCETEEFVLSNGVTSNTYTLTVSNATLEQ